jgi:hypothetical protein
VRPFLSEAGPLPRLEISGVIWPWSGATQKASLEGGISCDSSTFSPFRYFPFSLKGFMVPRGFAIGKLKISINIKGLAVAEGLWRAV